MDKPIVSIVIVNYNGARIIEECLHSLYKQTLSQIEIIVVDNNSSDNSIEILNKHADKIKLIKSSNNNGFAKGNNIGILEASGEFIALLNNDAIANSDWLEKMLEAINTRRDLGSCGCKIISYYERETMDSAGLLISVEGLSRGRGRGKAIDEYNQYEEILIPSGCAAMFRKSALDEVGLFDEDFFCYCEDTDLGLRLQLYGWKSVYVPDAIVYHKYSQTSGKYSLFKALLVERNHYWFLIKNYPTILIILNPIFTLRRFIYQFVSILSKKGATSEFASSIPKIELIKTLLNAHFQFWAKLPYMLKKRAKIQREKKITTKAFFDWLKNYNITLAEIFKD